MAVGFVRDLRPPPSDLHPGRISTSARADAPGRRRRPARLAPQANDAWMAAAVENTKETKFEMGCVCILQSTLCSFERVKSVVRLDAVLTTGCWQANAQPVHARSKYRQFSGLGCGCKSLRTTNNRGFLLGVQLAAVPGLSRTMERAAGLN